MRDIYVGRTASGERVQLDLHLTPKDTPAPHQDTAHRPTASVLELTMMVVTHDRAGREARAGQSIEALREVAAPGGLVDGPYSRPQIRRLADLWERYHLNGMVAGCIHQGAIWYCTGAPDGPHGTTPLKNGWPVIYTRFGPYPYPKRGDACYLCDKARWDEPTDFCPQTGYHYGSTWLSYEIPAADLAELQAFERQGLAGRK